MLNKIIAYVVIGLIVLLGLKLAIGGYGDLKETNAKQQQTITQLQSTIETNNKTYKENLRLIELELADSRKATITAVNNASKAESEFSKVRKELNETNNRYNDLIANGYRLRDPYARTAEAGTTNSDNRQGNDKEGNSTTAISSNSEAADNRLSEGFTRFLINRSIMANEVVNQLFIVQEYSKKQHAWILEHCNAVESTEGEVLSK